MSYKRLKIIKALKEYGFEFLREGQNHTILTNGNKKIPIGRHKEISQSTKFTYPTDIAPSDDGYAFHKLTFTLTKKYVNGLFHCFSINV